MPARKSTSKDEPASEPATEVPESPAPRKPEPTATVDPERVPRLALTLGGVLLVVGLALVGGGPSDVGRVVALAALLTMIYGVHSFGRLGAA